MALETEEIKQRIALLAKEELDWKKEIPSGDLSKELDSMQLLSLVVAIEDHFEICFEPEEDQNVKTLDEVAELVQSKLVHHG